MRIDPVKLRRRRIGAGMTVPDLARRANLSESLVYAIEAERTRGSPRSARALAEALGCQVEDLWSWEED